MHKNDIYRGFSSILVRASIFVFITQSPIFLFFAPCVFTSRMECTYYIPVQVKIFVAKVRWDTPISDKVQGKLSGKKRECYLVHHFHVFYKSAPGMNALEISYNIPGSDFPNSPQKKSRCDSRLSDSPTEVGLEW